jgi:hypothetical protein
MIIAAKIDPEVENVKHGLHVEAFLYFRIRTADDVEKYDQE